ncbi:MAG: hypothetical protein HKM04_02620 [Legionellales bacterium]|nr:hypothetical protein [Legionellales bacterium]
MTKKKDWIQIARCWLGVAGIDKDESAQVKKIDRYFEFGLLLIALWLPIQWYMERHHSLPSSAYEYTNWLIWLSFLAETLFLSFITKRKLFYLASNWLNLAIIIVLFPLFWVHLYITTLVRIIRFCVMFRFVLPWFQFSTDFLSRNHLGATLFVAILLTSTSGLLLASFDPSVKTAGDGIWWAWQTITTVGYGDIVPTSRMGRILAVLVMIFGAGLLAVLTGNFSAFFMARNQKKLLKPIDEAHLSAIHETLIRLERKIESLEEKINDGA